MLKKYSTDFNRLWAFAPLNYESIEAYTVYLLYFVPAGSLSLTIIVFIVLCNTLSYPYGAYKETSTKDPIWATWLVIFVCQPYFATSRRYWFI
jgi:hypothetical protein